MLKVYGKRPGMNKSINSERLHGRVIPDWNDKCIKPTHLLNKDPAKLSSMMVAVSTLVFILTCCILGRHLIIVKFKYIELMENFL